MRRTLASLAVLGAALAAAAGVQPAHAADRSETYTYIAANGDFGSLNCDGGLKVREEAIGAVCFDVLRGDTTVSLVVDDAVTDNVSITYVFENAAGDLLGDYTQICGTAGPLAIPAGAASFLAYVDTALTATSPCGGLPGTTGTMTATFTS